MISFRHIVHKHHKKSDGTFNVKIKILVFKKIIVFLHPKKKVSIILIVVTTGIM